MTHEKEEKYLAPIRFNNKLIWKQFMALTRLVDKRSATAEIQLYVEQYVETHKHKLKEGKG